jgi:Flp pilus assembly protein CpaB
MRSRWLLLSGIVLALLGGVLTFSYLKSLDRRIPVVIASRDLVPRTEIAAGDIRVAYIHPEAVAADAIVSTHHAIGRWTVRDILAGEQITASRTDLSLANRCAYGLGPDFRALFVPGGFARAAGGAVMPGDRVDLVAVTTGRSETVAYRLAVGLAVLEIRDERGALISSGGGASKAVLGGVLLAVPDFLVEPIALAIACGQVCVVIRDPAGFEIDLEGN